jgi:tetraacyldisaccharide 4'-kinase
LRAESYVEDVLYGRRKALLLGPVLFFLSLVYRVALCARRALYGLHVLERKKMACPVVSVGNITLGGTGKTPVVMLIAGLLLGKQRRPAVVSRGYGRKNEGDILVVSDGQGVLQDARTGGDEPVLIGSKIPGAPVVVGRDRYRAALAAVRRFGADVVILDDGFQRVQLRRTVDIVLVDALNPFGNGRLFPAGILREPPGSLKRAHAVLITRAESADELAPLQEIIRKHTRARIFVSRQVPVDLVDCVTGEIKPLAALRGSRVLALSGIAQPVSFLSLLRSLDAVVAGECRYPDHFPYAKSDLAQVFKKAADEKISMIVTTEKDAVRLKDLKPDGIWALRIETRVDDRVAWEEFLFHNL